MKYLLKGKATPSSDHSSAFRSTMLLEIITRREVQSTQRNLFDCAKGRPFSEGIAQEPLMFEAITAFLIVLSVGILVAHALDAFRP
jgi:hypothetical protein